jgi:hypothetical protein
MSSKWRRAKEIQSQKKWSANAKSKEANGFGARRNKCQGECQKEEEAKEEPIDCRAKGSMPFPSQ